MATERGEEQGKFKTRVVCPEGPRSWMEDVDLKIGDSGHGSEGDHHGKKQVQIQKLLTTSGQWRWQRRAEYLTRKVLSRRARRARREFDVSVSALLEGQNGQEKTN